MYGSNGNMAKIDKVMKTANNLEVSSACRLDNNTVLFLAGTSVLSDDTVLKELHLDTKTVEDFKIGGVKAYSAPMIAPDKKGMYISLKLENDDGGMYYYSFADKKLQKLFSAQDIEDTLPASATSGGAISTELVVQN